MPAPATRAATRISASGYTTREAWEWLRSTLTVDELRRLLPETRDLAIERYEFPNLGAVNFLIRGLLGTGATSTLRLDAQAKALGEWLRPPPPPKRPLPCQTVGDLMIATEESTIDVVRKATRELARSFDYAYWRLKDKRGQYPWEFVNAFAKGGWLGALIPEEYGGLGLGIAECGVMMQEIAASGAGASGASAVHFYLFPPPRSSATDPRR